MKPLFRDPDAGDEREDGYSEPHGFLLGPMGVIGRDEMADQYFRAANLLVDQIRARDVADYEIAYPVLYLYRHAMELVLKCLLRSGSNHHRLDTLAGDLIAFARREHQEVVPEWIVTRLHELAKIDPTSMAFRYGEDRYHDPKKPSGIPPETYVRVSELQEELNRLYRTLRRALNTQRGGRPDARLPV